MAPSLPPVPFLFSSICLFKKPINQTDGVCMHAINMYYALQKRLLLLASLWETIRERDSWTSSSPTAAVFLLLFLSHPLLATFLFLPVILPCSTQHPQASINNSSTQVTERASRIWALLTGGRATWLAGLSLQRPVAVQSAHGKGGVTAMIDRMLVECFGVMWFCSEPHEGAVGCLLTLHWI